METNQLPAYVVRIVDSERTPSWMDLCTTTHCRSQDSGFCTLHVTTSRASELEAALYEDDDVVSFRETDSIW